MPDDVIPFPSRKMPPVSVQRKQVKSKTRDIQSAIVETVNMQRTEAEPTVLQNYDYKLESTSNEVGFSSNAQVLAERIKRYCLLGMSDKEVAEALSVDVKLLRSWVNSVPEIFEAFKKGRLEADATVARSLYQRAVGYTQPAVKIFQARNGDVKMVNYTQHFPPDVNAAIHWLAIRQRENSRWQPTNNLSLQNSDGSQLQIPTIIINPVSSVKVNVNVNE